MTIASVNPATGETIDTFEPLNDDQIHAAIQRATETFDGWRRVSFEERSRLMQDAADLLESEKGRWADLMTTEMGKPIGSAVAEAEKCAWVCRYYAEHAVEFLADEPAETDASRSFVRYQPLGPVLAIMPWNFPFWQVFRFAAPGLMAGNVGLLKHASNVPQCALAIEEIFRRAGFPDGAFQTLLIGSDRVAPILDDPRIKAATLTGSTPAGSSVAETAGAHLKKTVLELGGSDPFIVMPSADLADAVETGVQARIINNGQSCIAAKRFIVHSDIADEFERRFVDRMAALRIGDPQDPNTEMGPLVTAGIRDELHEQVVQTVNAGATVRLGAEPLDRPGYYYAPTVLTNIPEGSPADEQELFGPVACLWRAGSLGEALAIANASRFGLGAAAWTNDAEERDQFIDAIEVGCAFVNGLVKSDPRLPFGGVKESGYGRELGRHGIREFVNIKTVWIR
jgi:succinate-semialdehyde dehydrogenase/glutarate-semialdehyde dehydrogenase